MAIIHKIREKVTNGKYEFTLPHFFEEMADDDLIFPDIEMVVANGRIRRTFTSDPRGIRYEVVGPAIDGRQIGIICRIKNTGKLLFITVYDLEKEL